MYLNLLILEVNIIYLAHSRRDRVLVSVYQHMNMNEHNFKHENISEYETSTFGVIYFFVF